MTIKDISKMLGVSVSTVSKALNDATDVSETTKKRILDYVESVGFNPTKKKQGEAKRVCLFFEGIGYSSSAQLGYSILDGFRNIAQKYNYEVIIKSINKDASYDYDNEMTSNNILGGFVIGANLHSELLNALKTTTVPTVLMDNYLDNSFVGYIGVDNIFSIMNIVSHLVELGHKKIGMLTGERHSLVSCERFAGYVSGLLSNGIDFDPALIAYGDFSKESGASKADFFVSCGVSAVVCASDLMAIGLIEQFSKKGVNVPNNISVTGFDDIEPANYYGLTTIKQDFSSIGESAFLLLRKMIKGFKPEKNIVNGSLIIRSSTAKI